MESQADRIEKIITHFIVISLLTIILGKVFFNNQSANLFLYTYGILVTSAVAIVFLVGFIKYKDPYESARYSTAEQRNYLVTCLVAVKDEQEVIRQCVDSFIKQSYKNIEIIFINDGSTDNTGEILREYESNGAITLIDLPKNIGKKKALAQGMLVAKGDIFAFSDSDSIIAPDAISKMVMIFNDDPLVGGVSGHCRALNGDQNILTRAQDSWYEGQFSVRKAFESSFNAVTCVSGPLAVFRKEAIYNLIPAWEHDTFLRQEFKFATDRTLTGFVLGSLYIGNKLKAKYKESPFLNIDYPVQNWKVLYTKSARAWTIVPSTFSTMLKQQIRWKKSFIRNIFFTGKFYWRKPILPSLIYYLHILFVFAGPFVAFKHLIYLPVRGDFYSALLYVAGIMFMGFVYGLAYKLENRTCHKWMYRPVMSLMSTLVFSWFIFYSAFTIRKMVWARG